MSVRQYINHTFDNIVSITEDKDNNLYVLEYVNDATKPLSYNIYRIIHNQVELVVPSTTFFNVLKDTGADELIDMTFNSDGFLFVSGTNNLYKIDLTMPIDNNVLLLGELNNTGEPASQGLCFDNAGFLYFTKATLPHTLDSNRGGILVISPSDLITYSQIINDVVVITQDIQEPIGITIDKDNNKYVCNSSIVIDSPPQPRFISKHDKDNNLLDAQFIKPPIFLSRYGSWNNIKIDTDNKNIYAVYTDLSYDVVLNNYSFAKTYILHYDISGKYIGIIKDIPNNTLKPFPLFVGSDNNVYYTDNNNTNIMYYSTVVPYVVPDVSPVGNSFNNIMNIPINDICFPSFTPVLTNVGLVNIENLNIGIHKINNKKILCVTKTICKDKHLILIKKNALGKNYPCKPTIISKNHKLYYRGAFVKARQLLDISNGVSEIPYKGDVLYNIVLEKHLVVNINNLMCETLHPNNPIAKLYLNVTNDEYKNKLVEVLNYSIINKDEERYKKIVSKITHLQFP